VNRARIRQVRLKYAFIPEAQAQFPKPKIQADGHSGIPPMIIAGT